MWLSFRTTWRPPLALPLCLATYAQAKHRPLYVCNFLPYNNLYPIIGSLAQFHSGVWRNSVREFGAIPFGSLAAKLTILPVFYCIPCVLLFFFKTSPSPHFICRPPFVLRHNKYGSRLMVHGARLHHLLFTFWLSVLTIDVRTFRIR